LFSHWGLHIGSAEGLSDGGKRRRRRRRRTMTRTTGV